MKGKLCMTDYNNEPFLRSEHLKRDGEHVAASVLVAGVLTNVPLMRKNKAYSGIALQFEKQDKVLGLNSTNESMMAVVCGDGRCEKWIGKTIRLEVREVVNASGGTEPAIRIMPSPGTKMRSGLVRQLGKPIGGSNAK
jgi:hypothetical protein